MRDFLSGLLARFGGLTRQQRLYALLAVVAAAVLLRYAGTALVEYRRGVKDDIQLTADRIANAKRTVERAEDLESNLEGLRQRYRETVAQLVPGDTPTLAAATLQERVSSVAGQRAVSLQTTQVMKDEAVGPFRRVSLRITAAAELRHLAEFLTDLEFGSLRIAIPFMEVNRRGGVRRDNAGRTVSATIEVTGIVQGSATDAKSGAGVPVGAPGAPAPGGAVPSQVPAPAPAPPPAAPASVVEPDVPAAAAPSDPMGTGRMRKEDS